MRRLLITLAALSVTTWAADNTLGTWKLKDGNTTMVRKASGDSVTNSVTGVRKDGSKIDWTYTAKYDGKEYPVMGNRSFDTISLRQIDANTLNGVASKNGGKHRMTGRIVVSKDGKTLSLTTSGTDRDGKLIPDETIVYERQ